MPKYHIIERQACVVSWRFPVEADDETDALNMYADGDHGPAEDPEIGDGLEHFQYDLEVKGPIEADVTIRWFIVVGRAWGADEASTGIYHAQNLDSALTSFKFDMAGGEPAEKEGLGYVYIDRAFECAEHPIEVY